jgi:hypothetical protein
MEEKLYECLACSYKTTLKTNYQRHMQSEKHLKNGTQKENILEKILMEMQELRKENKELKEQNTKILYRLNQILYKKDKRLKKEPKMISGKDFLQPCEPQNIIIEDGWTYITCVDCDAEFIEGEEEFEREGINNSNWKCKECR